MQTNTKFTSSKQPSNQTARWLALGGVVGPILFVMIFTLVGFLRPGYSSTSQAISDLGVGNNGWILNTSLIILGLLIVGFAFSFYRMVRTEASTALRIVCALLIAIVGVGYAVAGIFPETTPVHWIVGATSVYLGAVLAFLLAGLLLRVDPEWRGWAVYSLISSLATVVLIAITFYVFSLDYLPSTPPTARLGGLMERILFLEIFAWYVVFGWRLFHAQTAAA
ncbi:MAG TPA: DUF998 domain-containing protein [Anaerolineales bacterium]|nr:DUF998 domain-containing protein [Anaerolineales bacterium]